MPGGKIAVYTGILKVTKNKHGLAAVMGHEIAHAVAKHSIERASRALVLNVGTRCSRYFYRWSHFKYLKELLELMLLVC